MIIAIHLKTESGDGYMFLEEVSNQMEMLEEIEIAMDGELQHVYDYDIEVIDGSVELMRHCLQNRIEQLQDEEGDE